ncbi:hypothetical protein CEJ42_00800 [Herbaspirillum robiniae]|uniref:DUF6708 domain-containing protein n=2 Tax=Herbaspirillum robiniae TaxID=2014887 RepID=A0A246WWM2_9BURK|nr:hypothetical protein CEJ42_00800 [Herbaspirillum robiniae]
MADGIANLPVAIVRRREISFRRSLFAYMPYFDPSKEGSEIRARMGGLEWSLALVLIWFFWLLLPIGAFSYIALRCAPEPKWPTPVNEECHRGK